MKRLTILIISLLIVFCSFGNPLDSLSKANELINNGQLNEGFVLLSNTLYERELDSLTKALITHELIIFYENKVGYFDKSIQFARKNLLSLLPDGHELKIKAQNTIDRLTILKEKYLEEDKLLIELTSLSYRKNTDIELNNNIHRLDSLISNTPDYYRKAEIYFYLGINYKNLRKFRKSLYYYSKSIEEKPGIDFYVPTTSYMKRASVESKRVYAKIFANIFIGIFLLITIIMFYMSKPWVWIKFEHILRILLVFGIWIVTFFVVFYFVGKNVENYFHEHLENPNAIVFVFAIPGTPGSKVSWYLLLYGLIGIVGLFVFAIGMNNIRNILRRIIVPVVGICLFYSLASIFYITHIDNKGFASDAEGIFNKSYQFGIREIVPHVLTNPKAFPNLDANGANEEELRIWILENCLFDVEKSE